MEATKKNENELKVVESRVSLSSRSCSKKFPRERDEIISLVGESRHRRETALLVFFIARRNGEEMRERRVHERDGANGGCLFSNTVRYFLRFRAG